MTSIGKPITEVNKKFPDLDSTTTALQLPDFKVERSVSRTIHYLGSKLRVVDAIQHAVSNLAPIGSRVCDLFAGSGVVSLALASDWKVTSVDIQEYSRVLCNGLLSVPKNAHEKAIQLCDDATAGTLRARLRHALKDLLTYESKCLQEAANNSPEELCDLFEFGTLIPNTGYTITSRTLKTKLSAALDELYERDLANGPDTVVTRLFGGRYFSWEQSIEFDALFARIHSMNPTYRDFFLAIALITASDIVNTIGKQFAQPINLRAADGTPKRHLIKQTVRDRSMSVMKHFLTTSECFVKYCQISKRPHCTVRSDYVDFLRSDTTPFAAIYADPPYTRDHYSRFYHVLETMALHDEPELARTKIRSKGVPRISRGIYRLQRHQSPFCIPSKASLAFQELFYNIAKRETPLIFSYSPYQTNDRNRARLLTIDQLLDSANQCFRKVLVTPLESVTHAKLNLIKRNVAVNRPAELLITCLP